MPIVRELDLELSLIFRFVLLLSVVRQAKRKPRVFLWGRAQMTDCADYGAGAAECLTREKLLPMTADAGIMIRKVSDVGKCSPGSPLRWDRMTSIAGEALVLFRTVKEGRILCGASGRLRLGGNSGGRPALTPLGCGNHSEDRTQGDQAE